MIGEAVDIKLDEWILKVRQPLGDGPPSVIMMLHGWTGDENSMWVFASRLPRHAFILAPRAPYDIVSNRYTGHSWIDHVDGAWSNLEEYRSSAAALENMLENLSTRYDGDFSKIGLVGFSQGAAMCYAFALLHPQRVSRVAALAGFAPEQSEPAAAARPLQGIEILAAHGRRDEMVPLERAQQAVELMQMAGGKVEFCLSDVGHKLGANCFKKLETFFG